MRYGDVWGLRHSNKFWSLSTACECGRQKITKPLRAAKNWQDAQLGEPDKLHSWEDVKANLARAFFLFSAISAPFIHSGLPFIIFFIRLTYFLAKTLIIWNLQGGGNFVIFMHILVGLLLCAVSVLASSGDRLPQFTHCVNYCVATECEEPLPIWLRLMFWNCESNCDYLCQQRLTRAHINSYSAVHQYHGKWPFIRMLGIQEPASVLFSLLNLWPNWVGYRRLRSFDTSAPYGSLFPYYLTFAIVGINTWIWSSVFHVRDFVLTERLDYFSAILSIVYGLFLALVRLFRLDLRQNRHKRNAAIAALGTFYILHVSYLSLVHFDYGYNMAAGVVLGLIQNTLWITLSIKLYRQSKNMIDLLPAGLVVLVMGGMCFELFDFAPFALILDAHALWHLSTVLPTALWYEFMLHDLDRHRVRKHS